MSTWGGGTTYETNVGSSVSVPVPGFSLADRKLSSPFAGARGCLATCPLCLSPRSCGPKEAKRGIRPDDLPELSTAVLALPIF